MSSLNATKADGYYRGPNYDPKRDGGSLNKYRNSNGALGKRANNLHRGIMIVRFEIPFKIWCLGCNRIIDKGVRFNAEKKTIGYYFTTKILEFGFSCLSCKQWIKIHTDPKNSAYICHSGSRKKVEEYDAKDNETMEMPTTEEKAQMGVDDMFVLEKKAAREQVEDTLQSLIDMQDERNYDTQLNNISLRRDFRERKKLQEMKMLDNAPTPEEEEKIHEAVKLVKFGNASLRRNVLTEQLIHKTSVVRARTGRAAELMETSCRLKAIAAVERGIRRKRG